MTKKATHKLLIIILLSFVYTFSSIAQKDNNKALRSNISCAEKRWAVFHPFIAKKAFKVTSEVMDVVDSLKNSNSIISDIHGGQLDAFKHAYWMASLSQHINWKKALKLGNAHEKGNYKSYKKAKRKGFQTSHDKASSEMDLWNNQMGLEIGQELNNQDLIVIQKAITDSIQNGVMKIISKNSSGQFLDCEGNIIPKESLIGKWENEKCLVPSNQKNTSSQ